MIVLEHWSYDPFILVALAIALVHERGIRRLNARATDERARRRRRQALLFYAGLAVLLVAVCSPVDYWSDEYLWMHMVQHLLLLFAAPALVAVGAPWLPLEHGVPASLRRPVARSLVVGSWSSPLRWLGRFLRHPLTAVVGLNADVLLWHMPVPFDLAEDNQSVHIWLMHGSFFFFGLLFFLQIINSHPLRVGLSPQGQMLAIFCTACVFWVLAMAMALFSKGAWYAWYQAHEGPLLTPYADQQIGAGIMWICGDFWAVPAMIWAIRRLMDGRPAGELAARLDRLRPGSRGIRVPGPVPGRVHARLALQEEALEQAALDRLAAKHRGAGSDGGGPGGATGPSS